MTVKLSYGTFNLQKKNTNDAKIFVTIRKLTSHDAGAKLWVSLKISLKLSTQQSELTPGTNIHVAEGATLDLPDKVFIENGKCYDS